MSSARAVRKAFAVSTQWLWYAHGPGSDGGQRLAAAICRYARDAGDRDTTRIPPDRVNLVREIVSVAGLYTGAYGEDAEGRARARQAAKIIKRGRAWLEPPRKRKWTGPGELERSGYIDKGKGVK